MTSLTSSSGLPDGAIVSDQELSVQEIRKYFFTGLVLVLLADVPSTMGVVFRVAQLAIGVALVASFFMSEGRGTVLFLLLALTGLDAGNAGDYGSDAYSTAAIWQIDVWPIRPSWLLFACVAVLLVKQRKLAITPWMIVGVVWFMTVPVITGLFYGGLTSKNAVGAEIVKDLKLGIMLISSQILFLTAMRSNRAMLPKLVSCLLGGLLARHSVDLVYFTMNWGPKLTADVSRVSADSAKGAVVFLIFFGIVLVMVRRQYLLGGFVSVLSILLLAVYGTRLLWITFPLGALILAVFMGARRSIAYFVALAVLITGSMWMFYLISPKTAEVILARSISITAGRELHKFAVDVPYNVISRIDPIRYGEAMNVMKSLDDHFAFLWGMGYGGYYEDEAITFPHTLSSSFEDYSLSRGIFYNTHLYSLQTLLKHGLVGLTILSAMWWIPGILLFRRIRHLRMNEEGWSPLLYGVALCLLAFLPTAISQLYWSGKGLFINGAVLALCVELARHPITKSQESPRNP